MKGFGQSPQKSPQKKKRRTGSSPKLNSTSKKSIKLHSQKVDSSTSKPVNVCFDDDDDDVFDEYNEFDDDDESEDQCCEEEFFDADQEEDLSDDEEAIKGSVKLDGVHQVISRSKKETIFKRIADYIAENEDYLEAFSAKNWTKCCSLLNTYFLTNYSKPGVFMASTIRTGVKAYKRWLFYDTPFPISFIRIMMDNNYTRPLRSDPFEIIDATLHYKPQPPPLDSSINCRTPQQLGCDLEPYMRKLLEQQLLEDTEEKWKVFETGTLTNDDGLCICKPDGVAVKSSNPESKLLVEFKFVLPYKNVSSFDEILDDPLTSDRFKASLPVVIDKKGHKVINIDHQYGHQFRLSLSLAKLKKGLLVFGFNGLPTSTNDPSKIDYVKFEETTDYLNEHHQLLLNCVKDIIIPLMVHQKIDHKGNPRSAFSKETKWCVHCQKDIQIIIWSDASHLKAHQICSICNNKFNNVNQLKKHRHKIHEENPTYKCKICLKSFIILGALTNHLLTHGGQKEFVCDCGKSFIFKYKLERHRLIHLDKDDPKRLTWTCSGCDTKVDLYVQNIHTKFCAKFRAANDLPPPCFKCSGCSVDCKSYHVLSYHRRACPDFLKTTLTDAEKLLPQQQQKELIDKKIQMLMWTCVCGEKCSHGQRNKHCMNCPVYKKSHPKIKSHFICEGCQNTFVVPKKGSHRLSCSQYIALELQKKGLESSKELVEETKNNNKKECQWCHHRFERSGFARHVTLRCKAKVRQELTETEIKGLSEKQITDLVDQKLKSTWPKCPKCKIPQNDVKKHISRCKAIDKES